MPAPRIHHLSCGTMCPRGRRLLSGTGGWLERTRMVCHVLLVERGDDLVLIDTGFGTGDVQSPRQLSLQFNAMMSPRLQMGDTALAQIRELGFDPGDVRHVVLTHLDADHSGGLPDFPGAEVHVFSREYEAMEHPPLRERARYSMGKSHVAHGPRWAVHQAGGEQWMGFESIRVLPGDQPEILMIPLRGHTLGHTGIAVRRDGGWLLHCGDAYFHRDQMSARPRCPPGLGVFQTVSQADGKARLENEQRLRELKAEQAHEVELICSHDAVELDQAVAAG